MPLHLQVSPLLHKKAKVLSLVEIKAGKYVDFAAKMIEIMTQNNGIGLAANQIGEDLALFVIDSKLAQENSVPVVFANPEITEYGRESDILEEGCLSLPDFWIPITRSRKLHFKAINGLTGEKLKFKARGLLARVLQHETDHLKGLTIKDRQAENKTLV